MTEIDGRQAVVARSLTAAILLSRWKNNEPPPLARAADSTSRLSSLQFVRGRDRGHYLASDRVFVDADVSLSALNDAFYTRLLPTRGSGRRTVEW